MVSYLPEKERILDYLKSVKPELRRSGIDDIALFGSFATGQEDMFSDIDIAVKFKDDFLKTHDVWDYFKLIKHIKKLLLDRFSRKSDVFDLDSDSEMTERVQKEMIRV